MVRAFVIEKWLILPEVNEPANQAHSFGTLDELCGLLMKLIPRTAKIDLGWLGEGLASAMHVVTTDRLLMVRPSLSEEFPEWSEDDRLWSFETLGAARGEMRVRVWREVEPWIRALMETLESTGGPRLASVWPLAPRLLAKSGVAPRKPNAAIVEMPHALMYLAELKNGEMRVEWIGLGDPEAAHARLQSLEPSYAPAAETGVAQRGRSGLWVQTGWSGEKAAVLSKNIESQPRWTRVGVSDLRRHFTSVGVPSFTKLHDDTGGGRLSLAWAVGCAAMAVIFGVGVFVVTAREEANQFKLRSSLERELGQRKAQVARINDLSIEKANLQKLLTDSTEALPASPLSYFQRLSVALPREVSINRLQWKGGRHLLVEARCWTPSAASTLGVPDWAKRLQEDISQWIPEPAPATGPHWDGQRGLVRVEIGSSRAQP